MKQRISIGAVLIAISIFATSAATAAVPNTALGGPSSGIHSAQKHDRGHRPSWIQIIRHKAMTIIAMAKGGMGGAGAREARARAAMAKRGAASMQSQPTKAPGS
jgi:hypothetical protein